MRNENESARQKFKIVLPWSISEKILSNCSKKGNRSWAKVEKKEVKERRVLKVKPKFNPFDSFLLFIVSKK